MQSTTSYDRQSEKPRDFLGPRRIQDDCVSENVILGESVALVKILRTRYEICNANSTELHQITRNCKKSLF